MSDDKDILIGQKAICEYCGGVSNKTIRRWKKMRGFPVRMEGGTWVASKSKIREWTERNVNE